MNRVSYLALFFVVGNSVLAQTQIPAELLQIGSIIVHGSIRSRLELWDWFQGNSGDGSYGFSGNLLRLSFGQQNPDYDWLFELAAPILLGLPNNAVAPAPQGILGMGGNYYVANDLSRNTGMVFPKQGFVLLKNLFGKPVQSLCLGRFEFSDGSEVTPKDATLAAVKRDRITQRLIGPFGFTHVGRSFDGFHYIYSKPKTNVTLIGALPTRGVSHFMAVGIRIRWTEFTTHSFSSCLLPALLPGFRFSI